MKMREFPLPSQKQRQREWYVCVCARMCVHTCVCVCVFVSQRDENIHRHRLHMMRVFPPHGGRLRRRQRLRRQWKQCKVFIVTDCRWLVVHGYKCNPRVLGFYTPVPIHLVCSCVCQINDMEMKRKGAAERDKRFLQQRVIQDQKACVCVCGGSTCTHRAQPPCCPCRHDSQVF